MECKKKNMLGCPLTIIGPGSNNYGRGWGEDKSSEKIMEDLKKLSKKIKNS